MNRVGFLMREHEVNSLPASFHFLLGTWLSYFLFDQRIGTLSILILTFGDPIASLAGIRFGGKKITKVLELAQNNKYLYCYK
jgi:dolichol kinase